MSSVWDQLVVQPAPPGVSKYTPSRFTPRVCKPKVVKVPKVPKVKAVKPPAPVRRTVPGMPMTGGAINAWGLSPSQLRAADLLAHGADFEMIARAMEICRKTLDVHLGRARERMGVKNNTGLVAAWFRVNMVLEDEEAMRLTNERLVARLAAAL